ncbi:unnamed protein product [Mesocestoides corti]|uniref:Cleavage and polyadenylation specificity factor subunit 1 n=1 Tax=Mesocestoides corti TaxID=53468 RepID=A0A0R3UIR9_MESCO|nr:unnamed protein product [Mesocestoides corti]
MNFDIHSYELKTCSLHTYEQSSLKGGRLQFTKPPLLRVDPLQRCAVMLVYDKFLAVLPFRRADALTSTEQLSEPQFAPTVDAAWQNKATAPILSSFTTFLSTSTGERINNVIDMQFLYGFYEPTLFVLYEPVGTWAGRVSARRDTCCIVALSLNLQKRTNPVIWFQELLPYDCHTVLPIPMPVGGVVIIATNSIIYLKQTLPSRGLPLNCYAKASTNFPLRQDVPSCGPLSLDACHAALLSPSEILIISRTGTFYILTLLIEKATHTVTKLILSQSGTYLPAETITVMDDNHLFVGSCLSDSMLMKYRLTSTSLSDSLQLITSFNVNEQDKGCIQEAKSPQSKRSRLSPESEISAAANGTPASGETDAELYGPSLPALSTQPVVIVEYIFEPLDTLRNIGPMSAITAGEVPCLATGHTDPTDESLLQAQTELAHTELIACVARRTGCGSGIVQLHRSVRAQGLTAFELPEYNSLWSLYGPPVGTFTRSKEDEVKREAAAATAEEGDGELEKSGADEGQGENESEAQGDPTSTTEAGGAAESAEVKPSPEIDQPPTPEQLDASGQSLADGENINEENEVTTTEVTAATPPSTHPVHSYLLLTREDSSMILEVGDEIVELEVSGFKTTETTVVAANLGVHLMRDSQNHELPSVSEPGDKELTVGRDYPYIIQVSPTSLRLLNGPHLLEDLHLTSESRICLASVADPYVLVGTEDDDLILFALHSAPVEEQDSRKLNPERGDASLPHPFTDPDPVGFLKSTSERLPFSRYLSLSRPKVSQIAPPVCFCLYYDEAGRLSQWLNSSVSPALLWHTPRNAVEKDKSVNADGSSQQLSALDEEDILLYGEIVDICKKERPTVQPALLDSVQPPIDSMMECLASKETTSAYFAFVVFSNGVLEIYSLPEFTCLYEVRQFTELPGLLCDCRGLPEPDRRTKPTSMKQRQLGQTHCFSLFVHVKSLMSENDDMPAAVREISVFPIDRDGHRPVLFVSLLCPVLCLPSRRLQFSSVRLSDWSGQLNPLCLCHAQVRTAREVVCYEALCAFPDEAVPLTPTTLPVGGQVPSADSRCPLRWRRLPVSCPLLAPGRLRSDPRVADIQSKLVNKMNILRPFEEIGGHRGIFVCGSQPVWMFCSRLGHIRVYPHTIDGVMTSFAPLNISSCPDGFVYFTHANEMKLATLPPGYSYEGEVGISTIPLDACPRFLQYHLESKTYIVVSSTETPCHTIVRLNADGNKEEELVDRPETCVFPSLDIYKMQVIAPLPSSRPNDPPRFEVVPNSVIEFEPFEEVTCLVTAQLSSDLTFNESKDYLALGSNLSYGEEIPVRGRIVLVDIIEVVPEPGLPLTRHKVKTVYDGDQKGPVTALASCQGYLISAVGQKIYIWALKGGDLEGVAFVDTDLYIHSLVCVKNLILAADVLKSIQLLRFQSSMRVLSLVSRDSALREVFAANFFVDGIKLGFLITDNFGNLLVYSYDPEEPASCSGRRLVRRADMRLPSVATTSLRVSNRFRHPLLSTKALQAEVNELRRATGGKLMPPVAGSSLLATLEYERSRHSVYFGTRTGAIYLITPIRDKMFSRLRIVEKNLVQCSGCLAGLIPRVCRQYNQPFPELSNSCGNVADGDLILRYLLLPHGQRLEVAKKSGQSLESVGVEDSSPPNCTKLPLNPCFPTVVTLRRSPGLIGDIINP